MNEKKLSNDEIQAHLNMYQEASGKSLYFYMQQAANQGIKGSTKQLAWAKQKMEEDER